MLSWWDPWLGQNPGGRRCVASLSPSPRSGPFSTCGSMDDLRRRFLLQHLLGLLLGHLSGSRPCSPSTIPLVLIYFMAFPKQSPMCHEIKKWLGGQVDVLIALRGGEQHTRRRWPVQEEPGGQVIPALALQEPEDTSHTPSAECTHAGVPGL